MQRRRYVESDEPVVEERPATTERTVSSPAWSPAQLVALAIGLLFVVIGGVVLARTGLNLNQIVSAEADVMGFGHTMLMGIITLLFGLMLVAAGAIPGADRGGMIAMGVILLGFGLIVAIEPNTFGGALGVHAGNGWLYVITGAITLAAGMLSPVIFGRDRTYVR